MRSQNIFFYFIQLVKTISLLSHTVVMCVNAAHSHWVLSFSIVLLASTFLRSPFSIRSAQHSVEILSSIGSKVLLNTAANNSNQPKEKRGIYSKLFAHSLWTFFLRHVLSTRQSETSKKNCGSKISQILSRENQAATLVWSKISLWFSNRIIDCKTVW